MANRAGMTQSALHNTCAVCVLFSRRISGRLENGSCRLDLVLVGRSKCVSFGIFFCMFAANVGMMVLREWMGRCSSETLVWNWTEWRDELKSRRVALRVILWQRIEPQFVKGLPMHLCILRWRRNYVCAEWIWECLLLNWYTTDTLPNINIICYMWNYHNTQTLNLYTVPVMLWTASCGWICVNIFLFFVFPAWWTAPKPKVNLKCGYSRQPFVIPAW